MSSATVPLSLVGVDPFFYSHLKLMIGHVHLIVKNQVDREGKKQLTAQSNNQSINRSTDQANNNQSNQSSTLPEPSQRNAPPIRSISQPVNQPYNPWLKSSINPAQLPSMLNSSHLQQADQSEEQYPPGTLLLGGHVVNQVEIVGVIVSLAERNKTIEYYIDDGSGVMRCQQWVETPQADDPSTGQWVYQSADQKNFQSIYRSTRTLHLCLGHTVRVLGKIIKYWDETSIKITSIHRLIDPNAEMLHAVECMRLYPIYQSIDPKLMAVNDMINQMKAGNT